MAEVFCRRPFVTYKSCEVAAFICLVRLFLDTLPLCQVGLLAIYFVGGEVISDFTLAMIWGVLIGTYSSIFVASAFLAFFNLRRTSVEEEENLSSFNNE